MGNVFGKKKSVAEILKDAKRLVNRSIRELQREQRGMEREEKQLIKDIKKHAKQQQMVRYFYRAVGCRLFVSCECGGCRFRRWCVCVPINSVLLVW